MVSLKKAMDVPENIRHEVKVEEIMIPSNDLIIMTPDRKADEGLMQMTQKHSGSICMFRWQKTIAWTDKQDRHYDCCKRKTRICKCN